MKYLINSNNGNINLEFDASKSKVGIVNYDMTIIEVTELEDLLIKLQAKIVEDNIISFTERGEELVNIDDITKCLVPIYLRKEVSNG